MVSLIKDRLKARQEEVKDLERRLRILEADNEITISRDMILSYMEMLRDGDVEDRAYQEMLIDTFLIRAYVFDDGRLKLIFNYQKEHREVTIALEDFSRKEGAEDCGEVRLSSSHLHQSGRRRTVAVYMVKGYFVCDISFAG